MNTLEEVLQRLSNDAEFREKFKNNPVEALTTAGFTLNVEDMKKIQSYMQRDQPKSGLANDEELDKRISK